MTSSRSKRKGTDKLPFANILNRVMKERGLSIGAIAEMAGVSRSVVQSWISRANPHDLQAVSRLAKALNMGFKDLLLGEPEIHESEKVSIETMFDEQELIDGLCLVKIKKLIPKKGR